MEVLALVLLLVVYFGGTAIGYQWGRSSGIAEAEDDYAADWGNDRW